MRTNDFVINPGVLLTGIANENKRQVWVGSQNARGVFQFLPVAAGAGQPAGQTNIAQNQRAGRNVVELKKRLQQVVKIPRGAGNIKNRIALGVGCFSPAIFKGVVQPRNGLQRLARAGIGQHGQPQCNQWISQVGMDDRVVHITDHTETRCWRRDQDMTRGADCPAFDLHIMPARCWWGGRLENDVEISLSVRGDLDRLAAPGALDGNIGNFCRHTTLPGGHEIGPPVIYGIARQAQLIGQDPPANPSRLGIAITGECPDLFGSTLTNNAF